MKLNIFVLSDNNEILTDRIVKLEEIRRRGYKEYEVPDNFSLTYLIEEAKRVELEKRYEKEI